MTRKQTISSIIAGAVVAVTGSVFLLTDNTPSLQHGAQYKYVKKGSDNGVFITSANAGDTFVFKAADAPFSYCYVGGVKGAANDSITLMNEGGQVLFTQGITIEDANYVCVDGTGAAGVKYGFKLTNGIQVPGVIKGLSNYISWHNTELTNNGTGNGIFWDKTEVVDAAQHGCDKVAQWLYPNGMFHHNIYNNYFHSSGDDLYIGSTGSLGRDPLNCNGKTTYPKTLRMGDINFHDNIVDSLGRSFQISGCDTLGAHVWNNTFTHFGYEYNNSQGAVAFGSGDRNIEFDHNTVDYTWLNFYSYATGIVSVHDNTFDHAAMFSDAKKSTQQIASTQFSSMDFDSTTWIIYNNKTGYNSAQPNTGFAFYPNSRVTKNNVIANNTGSLGGNINFTFSTIHKSDSTVQVNDTIKVKCDTLQITHHAATIVFKTTVTFKFKSQDTIYYGINHYKIRTFGDTAHTVIADTTRQAYDDTIICYKCGFRDSIIYKTDTSKIVDQPNTIKVGIMPFKFAQAYNTLVTRDEINYQYWQTQPSLIARIKAYNKDSVIININNKNADLSPADFVHDTTAFKQNIIAIVKATGAKYVVIENENDYPGYYRDNADNYIPEVIAAVHALTPLGVTVYNGGFVKIRFWYYLKTHDVDFLNTCIPSTAKGALLRGDLAKDSASVQKQINAFKNLKGFVFNVHQLYVTNTNEFPGLHRMIEYLNKETNGNAASNEAGSYANDPAIFKGLVQLARDENMQWMILYSGLGTGNGEKVAVPITQTSFVNALR